MIKKFEHFTGGGLGQEPLRHAGADRVAAHRCTSSGTRSASTTGSTTSSGRSRSRSTSWRGCSCADVRGARCGRCATARRRRSPPGVSLARYKTLAFGVSAAYAGLAGSLFAIATTYVNPDTFPISLSIFLLVGVVVGGLGSLARRDRGRRPDRVPAPLGAGRWKSPGAPSVVYGVVADRAHVPATDGRRRTHASPRSANNRALPSSLSKRLTFRRRSLVRRTPDLAILALIAISCSPCAPPRSRARRGAATTRASRPTSILLGATTPLTGPASAYSSVARGANAYFQYVNAKGGVFGRKITYTYLDDAYNPANTVHADAPARRAGPRLRDLQLARHGAEPRHARLPERDEGAAALRRHRRHVLRRRRRQSTRTRSGSSRATRPRATCSASTSAARTRRRRSRCWRRTTATAAISCSGSSAASPAARRR